MVYMKENDVAQTRDAKLFTKKPEEVYIMPVLSEVDPEVIHAQINQEIPATKVEADLKKEEAELKRAKEEQAKTTITCKKTAEKAEMLKKKILTLEELAGKYRTHVKADEKTAETKEWKAKLNTVVQEAETLKAEKAKVEKLEKEAKAKLEKVELKVEKLESKKQERSEQDPRVAVENKLEKTTNVCKALIEKKEAKLEEADKLKKTVDQLTHKLKVETSPLEKKKLEKEVAKVKTEVTKMEKEAKTLTKDIKKNKKAIEKCNDTLKKIKKDFEKEKVKDLVKGECTAYTIRPHKRYCVKYDAKKVCTQWKSIYRTDKCLVYDGEKCVQKSYKYSKDTARYECVSRDDKYKVERCVKFDSKGVCTSKKTFYGIKTCMEYATNNKQIVCLNKKVVFPEFACGQKEGTVCREAIYHRPRFYCEHYKLNSDGHRYCHKKDVYFGERNYRFVCVKNTDKGCMQYKKELVPGAETLKKMSKEWLKENCKALNKDPIKDATKVTTKKADLVTENQKNKDSKTEKKEKIREEKIQKIIAQCKAEVKDKLRAIRQANGIVERQRSTADKVQQTTGTSTETKDATTDSKNRDSKVVDSLKNQVEGKTESKDAVLSKKEKDTVTASITHQKLTPEQKKKIAEFEKYSLEKIAAEKNLIKKAEKVIVEQKKKLESKDPVVVKKAQEVIAKQAGKINNCKAKITKLSVEGMNKWSVGRLNVESRKIIKEQVKQIEKAAEVTLKAKQELLRNDKLLKETKDPKVVERCKKNIIKAQAEMTRAKLIQERASTVANQAKAVLVKRLGDKSAAEISKPLEELAKSTLVVDNCNKKIVTAEKAIQEEKAKIETCKSNIKALTEKLQKTKDPKIESLITEEKKKIENCNKNIQSKNMEKADQSCKKWKVMTNGKIVKKEAKALKADMKKIIKEAAAKAEACRGKIAEYKKALVKTSDKRKLTELIEGEQKKLKECAEKIKTAKSYIIKGKAAIIKTESKDVAVRKADKIVKKFNTVITKAEKVVLDAKKAIEMKEQELKKLGKNATGDKVTAIKKAIAEKQAAITKAKDVITVSKSAIKVIVAAKKTAIDTHNKKVAEEKKMKAIIKIQKAYLAGKSTKTATKTTTTNAGAQTKTAKTQVTSAQKSTIIKKCNKGIEAAKKELNKGRVIRKKIYKEISMEAKIVNKEEQEVQELKDRIRDIETKKVAYKVLVKKGGKRKIRVKIADKKVEIRNIRKRVKVLEKHIKITKKKIMVNKKVLRKIRKENRQKIKKIFKFDEKKWKLEKPTVVKREVMKLNKALKKKNFEARDYIKQKKRWIKRYEGWVRHMNTWIKSGKYPVKKVTMWKKRITKLEKRIRILKKRIARLEERIARRKRRIMKYKLIALRKEPNPEVAKQVVIKMNKKLRKRIFTDKNYIKAKIPVIRRYKKWIKKIEWKIKNNKIPVNRVKHYKAVIAKLRRRIKVIKKNIRKARRRIRERKSRIIRNKVIIMKKYKKHIGGKIIRQRVLVKVMKTQIIRLRRKMIKREKVLRRIRIQIRGCRTEKCKLDLKKREYKIISELVSYRKQIRKAKITKRKLIKVIRTLERIRLVRVYYKRHLTCNTKENWKAFRIMRNQRVQIIQKAVRNIESVKNVKTANAKRMVRVWARLVKRETTAIKRDKMRVKRVIRSCNRLRFFRKKALIFKKLIKEDATVTCNQRRLTGMTKKIIGLRNDIINKVNRKIKKDTRIIALSSDPKKRAEYMKLVEKYKRIIRRQLRNVARDRARILRVIKQCAVIKSNSLTVVKKQTTMTCNPIVLRNRVHNIVNDVFFVIRKAKLGLKRARRVLRTSKNKVIRRRARRAIRRYRVIIRTNTQKVLRDKKKLSKIIKVCARYGYIVKTNVYIKNYTNTSSKIRTIRSNFWKNWLSLVKKRNNALVYRKLITSNPRVTCNTMRIRSVTSYIVNLRYRIIRGAQRKIFLNRVAIKRTNNAAYKKRLQALIVRYERIVQRQVRNIKNDEARIIRVIRRCVRVNKSSRRLRKYTYIRKIMLVNKGGKKYKWVRRIYSNDAAITKARTSYYKSWYKILKSGKANTLVYKKLITSNPKTTCNKRRIKKTTRYIVRVRTRIIRKARRNISYNNRAIRRTKSKKTIAKLQKLNIRYKMVIRRQRRNIRRDRTRILRVIRRCVVLRNRRKSLTKYLYIRRVYLKKGGKTYMWNRSIAYKNRRRYRLSKRRVMRRYRKYRVRVTRHRCVRRNGKCRRHRLNRRIRAAKKWRVRRYANQSSCIGQKKGKHGVTTTHSTYGVKGFKKTRKLANGHVTVTGSSSTSTVTSTTKGN